MDSSGVGNASSSGKSGVGIALLGIQLGTIRGTITHDSTPLNTASACVAYLWRGCPAFWVYIGPHRRRGCRVVTSSTLSNMETPSAFDHSIHFSVPTRQRSTFDREVAGLPPAFLGLSTTGE